MRIKDLRYISRFDNIVIFANFEWTSFVDNRRFYRHHDMLIRLLKHEKQKTVLMN
jgi:hypothetical protein